MGYITMAITAITFVALVFGFLFGLMRGLNRSVLRLVLVVASAVIAIFARGYLVDIIMEVDTGNGTIEQALVAMLSEGDALPESLQSLVLALVEIIAGLLVFYAIFLLLQFLTWIIVFPIFKIFVPKGSHCRRLVGGVIGVVQGIVIAFVACAPLTGVVTQVDKISKIEIQGEKVIVVPAELGFEEYMTSPTYKVYNTAGSWFFDMVTSTTTADGNKVSISDTVDVAVAVSGIANTITELQTAIENISREDATDQERIDAMKDVGDGLVDVGNQIDQLSSDAKAMINGVISSVKDMIDSENVDPEVEDFIENFDIDDFNIASVGRALNGMASYVEKTSGEFGDKGEVTQQEVNSIIGGFADNTLILDMIIGGDEVVQFMDVDNEHESMFKTAIENNTKLSTAQKIKLKQAFGI